MKYARWIKISLLLWVSLGGHVVDARAWVPGWVRDAMKQVTPEALLEDDPEAVVLWDEQVSEVRRDGAVVSRRRYAVRVLDNAGRDRAVASVYYNSESSKPPKIKAWTIPADGKVYSYSGNDQMNLSTSKFVLKTEQKFAIVSGRDRTGKGDVFAYEVESKDTSVFTQSTWAFQQDVPVLYSGIQIEVPKDWGVRAVFRDGVPQSAQNDRTWRWVMRNLPARLEEYRAPSSTETLSRLHYDLIPPVGKRGAMSSLGFNSWADVSTYAASTIDPRSTANDEIVSKVHELLEGADSNWEKVRRIGDFAREIRYNEIEIDLNQGGGYTPRAAEETLRVGYGDCKDKTALMRAMLGVVGIPSYALIVHAFDSDAVDENWPSPRHFNHCVALVEVDETVDLPAVFEDPELGRIMLIDPTSADTPVGEIPYLEQGGLAVVARNGFSRLLRLPLSAPEENTEQRTTQVELLAGGGLLGVTKVVSTGWKANYERSVNRRLSVAERQELTEKTFAQGNSSPKLEIVSEIDDQLKDRAFSREIQFGFRTYSKVMRDRLLVFKPAVIERKEKSPFSSEDRTLPVRLRPERELDENTIFLPEGFVPDDFKPEIRIETEFGSYVATLTVEEDKMLYRREFIIEDYLLPADRYDEMQEFWGKVVEADQSPVVLVRQR